MFDSLVDGEDPADDHRLRFEYGDVAVDLDVSSGPEGSVISGRVRPGGDRVALHQRSTDLVMVSELDESRFAFPLVPHGLVRLSVESSDPDIWTDWFRL